jgi:hypothetical protein
MTEFDAITKTFLPRRLMKSGNSQGSQQRIISHKYEVLIRGALEPFQTLTTDLLWKRQSHKYLA